MVYFMFLLLLYIYNWTVFYLTFLTQQLCAKVQSYKQNKSFFHYLNLLTFSLSKLVLDILCYGVQKVRINHPRWYYHLNFQYRVFGFAVFLLLFWSVLYISILLFFWSWQIPLFESCRHSLCILVSRLLLLWWSWWWNRYLFWKVSRLPWLHSYCWLDLNDDCACKIVVWVSVRGLIISFLVKSSFCKKVMFWWKILLVLV